MFKQKKILLDARFEFGKVGGVGTLVNGLLETATEFASSDLLISLITYDINRDNPIIKRFGERHKIHFVRNPSTPTKIKRKILGVLRIISVTFGIKLPWQLLLLRDKESDNIGADIVHYLFQTTFHANSKSIYHPHDLQHLYLKKFFSLSKRLTRTANYKVMCESSTLICVASNWVKNDIIKFFKISPSKIRVIELAPTLSSYNSDNRSEVKFKVTKDKFLLYPAANWPHKNHERLLCAVRELRDVGLDIKLVLTGMILPNYTNPGELAVKFGVGDLVTVKGRVEFEALDDLYNNARAVVVPTLFEAASFPIMEAQVRGKAVACSNVTSLPEQVGSSALIFDPYNVSDIAGSLRKLWTDDDLVSEYEERSLSNTQGKTWLATFRLFEDMWRHS